MKKAVKKTVKKAVKKTLSTETKLKNFKSNVDHLVDEIQGEVENLREYFANTTVASESSAAAEINVENIVELLIDYYRSREAKKLFIKRAFPVCN